MSCLVINVLDIWIVFRTMSEGQPQTESLRWAMIFEHTMCPSNLQGTQIKETGR